MAVTIIARIASFAIKFLLPFLPLDRFKANIAPLLALGATLNPINAITHILLILTTLFLYLVNPFGMVNVTSGTKTKKSFWRAFKWSFLILIPMFFIYWIIIHYVLKYLV